MITIHRPFWFRWWFLVLVLFLIAGFIYLFVRFILSSRYRKKLVEMVEIRTRELEDSESMLRESNKAKDNFFSIIAHDLRSPFNVMLGMLDLLITEYEDYSDDERQMILNRLKNASLRTIDLLDNLLTWARGQRGLLPFTPGNINLHELLKHNISLVEPAAQSKDILIKLNGQDNICAYADRNMMNTVARNLLSNAIKFSFPGGLITIDLSLKDNRTVLVSVKDNGFGMNPEIQGNLFRIEHRMVTKGTNNETGTGLGLILCKDFITRNNGEIRVESEEGAGSTFYFTLPAGFFEPPLRDSSVPQ
jgi:signal transduction histidine kinase